MVGSTACSSLPYGVIRGGKTLFLKGSVHANRRADPIPKKDDPLTEIPHLTYEEIVGAGLRTMRVCFCFMFLRAV